MFRTLSLEGQWRGQTSWLSRLGCVFRVSLGPSDTWLLNPNSNCTLRHYTTYPNGTKGSHTSKTPALIPQCQEFRECTNLSLLSSNGSCGRLGALVLIGFFVIGRKYQIQNHGHGFWNASALRVTGASQLACYICQAPRRSIPLWAMSLPSALS